MILNVHDSLIFEIDNEYGLPNNTSGNHPIFALMSIMEKQGDTIGVPTPVDMKVVTTTWGKTRAELEEEELELVGEH